MKKTDLMREVNDIYILKLTEGLFSERIFLKTFLILQELHVAYLKHKLHQFMTDLFYIVITLRGPY